MNNEWHRRRRPLAHVGNVFMFVILQSSLTLSTVKQLPLSIACHRLVNLTDGPTTLPSSLSNQFMAEGTAIVITLYVT